MHGSLCLVYICGSGHQRGHEHGNAIKQRDPDHPIIKHFVEKHLEDEAEPEIKMKVEQRFKSAMRRQITEAINISSSKADETRQSKPCSSLAEKKT